MNPLVSIIIPVYNVEKYLRKCLDSVCSQTYRNLEILCVNDGSTDGSASILEEYAAKDERIKILSQKNAGQGAARNLALNHATGEWVTGVDADDFLETDAIEYAYSAFSDSVDIVTFRIKIIWENTAVDPSMEKHFARTDYVGVHPLSARLLLDKPCEFCAKLWRRSFLESQYARFPEGVIFEDWAFYWMYAPSGRNICFLPDAKYGYIRRQGSTMSIACDKSPRALQHIAALEQVLGHRKEHPLPQADSFVNLENFYLTYQFVRNNAPCDMQDKALCEFRRIAAEYGLLAHYPARLRFLYPQRWWQQLFVRHRFGKSTYGFGPLKPLAIRYRNADRIVRLFGVKLYKTR